MNPTLLTAGISCIIAAIVGGGLKAFGIEIPVLNSRFRQLALGGFGIFLTLAGLLLDIYPSRQPETPSNVTPKRDPSRMPSQQTEAKRKSTELTDESAPSAPEASKLRKYSADALKRRRQVLDEYADKINGPVLDAFHRGRKLWNDWNNANSQVSTQRFLDRLTDFKKETMGAFNQIDELWRKHRFEYPEITGLTDWTNNRVLEKTNALLFELPRFSRFNETDARSAMMNNRIVDEWYAGINDFDQWIIAKRKVIADKRKEYEAAEISGDDSR
jgi:hypothetical protein